MCVCARVCLYFHLTGSLALEHNEVKQCTVHSSRSRRVYMIMFRSVYEPTALINVTWCPLHTQHGIKGILPAEQNIVRVRAHAARGDRLNTLVIK